MTQTQTHTAEAGDATTVREAGQCAYEAWRPPGRNLKPWDKLTPYERAEWGRIAAGALAASPAPRAPAAVPEELREACAKLCETEAAACIADIVPGDDLGAKLAHARASALVTAAGDIRTLAAAPAAPPADGGTDGLREALEECVEALKVCREDDRRDGNMWLNYAIGSQALQKAEAALSSRTPAGAAGDPVTELVAKAEGQVAYWRERQAAEKCLEDGISEDGETYTPIGDEAAWQGGYCNGRMSEADWWVSTLRALATRPASPAPAASAGGEGASRIEDLIVAYGNAEFLAGGNTASGSDADLEGPAVERARNALMVALRAALAPAAQVNPGREKIALALIYNQYILNAGDMTEAEALAAIATIAFSALSEPLVKTDVEVR